MARVEIDISEYIELDDIEDFITCADESEVTKIIEYCKERDGKLVKTLTNLDEFQQYAYELNDEYAAGLIKWLKHYKPYLFDEKNKIKG